MNSWRSRCLQPLVDGAATPRRTAAAFAIGAFLSFSPFIGVQIAAGLGTACLLRLSRGAMIIGLCTNLPWIMLPWYTVTTFVGAKLLGLSPPPDIAGRLTQLVALSVFGAEFWRRAAELVAPFAWSFVVGTTLAAIVMGAIAYFAAFRFLERIRLSQPALEPSASQ